MSAQARTLVAVNAALLVTQAVPAGGGRPTLNTDGVDLSTWKANSTFAAPSALLVLDGSAAQTLASPTGGASGPELWGYVTSMGLWCLIGYLNNGSSIPIVADAQGWAQRITNVGVFDRLAVAATVSAGTCAAKFMPIDEWV